MVDGSSVAHEPVDRYLGRAVEPIKATDADVGRCLAEDEQTRSSGSTGPHTARAVNNRHTLGMHARAHKMACTGEFPARDRNLCPLSNAFDIS